MKAFHAALALMASALLALGAADMKARLQVADAEGGDVEQREPGLAEGQTGREDVGRERRDSAWSGAPTPTDCCGLERPIEQPSSRVVPQRGMVSDMNAARLMEEAVAFAEAKAAGLDGTYRIAALQRPTLPKLPPGELSFEASHLSKQNPAGRFFVVFRLRVDGRPAGTARVDLEGKWSGRIIRARNSLPRKSVPEEEQLEVVPFEGQAPAGALTSMPAGFRLRNPVTAGHILCLGDLEPIPLVNAGDRVRLTMRSGQLSVSTEGTARTYGALNERVRVELTMAKRQVQAVVMGPGEVSVEWK